MYKMAFLQAEDAELREANALVSKRRRAKKKHGSDLEDYLTHKTCKIFRIKGTLRLHNHTAHRY